MRRAVVSWSGGKDCYLALRRASETYDIVGLVTMMTEDGLRSRSHGLRPEVLQAQADVLGFPWFRAFASWEDYESKFNSLLQHARSLGSTHVIFGDIQSDVSRRWAATACASASMTAVEPLWQERTADVVKQFLETGSVAILCTVRDSYLEDHFLGSELNDRFLRTCYDRGIDPCGEKAEFHTVVTRFGFAPSLKLRAGRIHKSDGCSSIDLELISGDGSSRDLKP